MSASEERIRSVHDRLKQSFTDYRNQLSDVLFRGEPISRSELQEGKDELVRGLRLHVDAVQRILFPAITTSDNNTSFQPANILAPFQNRLLSLADRVDERVDFFANPEGEKEERNQAARNLLKDLYRIDGLLNTYLDVLEEQCLKPNLHRLDPDEQESLLADLEAASPSS